MLSKPPLARSFLRLSPLLSRQHEREENGHKKSHKNSYENGRRFHYSLLRTVYTFQASSFTIRVAKPAMFFGSLLTQRGIGLADKAELETGLERSRAGSIQT